MGSTMRHLFDAGVSGVSGVTLAVLILCFLGLLSHTRGKLLPTLSLLAFAALALDMPWEASLIKREGYLKPIFQVLGRDEL